MSGIEVAVGTHFIDTLAGIIFAGIIKNRPKSQTKSGDDYLDRTLVLTQEYREILRDDDRKAIKDEFEIAGALKNVLQTQSGIKAWTISHQYKRQAKQTFVVAKERSSLRRMAQAFAMDVADAVVDIAERETTSPAGPALAEAAKDDLRLRVVDSIDSSPEGRLYSHENTSSAAIAEAARKVWEMMKHNKVNVGNVVHVKNTVNVEDAVLAQNAANVKNSVQVANSVCDGVV